MSDPTVGRIEFGPERKPPPEPRPPMGPLRDCTVIGAMPDPVYPEIALEVRVEHLEAWARTALERGLKAWQEDVL